MIYIVDDDVNISELLKAYLLKEEYDVTLFHNGSEAWEVGKSNPPNMWIVDIMMPVMDGYTLCRHIRQFGETPLIMISAKDEELDRIVGLELGSDDYLSKPFSPRELLARMKTIFRRVDAYTDKEHDRAESLFESESQLENKSMIYGNIQLLTSSRTCTIDAHSIELTTKEFNLLEYFIINKNRALTREQLLQSVWGYDFIGETRAVDDMIKRLRKKLIHAGANRSISTLWGYGYKIEDLT